jgi:hypothetical protein
MVFLFPGVLFRKFYYSGKFTNQFNQGNLLERFLWTIFLSVISLVLCSCFIYYVTSFSGIKLIHNIDFCTISGIFESLATNKYPDAFTNESKMFEIAVVVSTIWVLSAAIGYFCYKLVMLLSLHYVFSTLRFSNEWHYISIASKENGVSGKWSDNFVTYLDILIQKKEKEELYRGRLKHFFLDKENKIEHIVIENPSKFISIENTPENLTKISALETESINQDSPFTIHKRFLDKVVFKKDIEGKVFILPYENVVNVNITYLKFSNKFDGFKRTLLRCLLFFFYVLLISIVIFPFIKIENAFFDTFIERLFFSVVTLFTSTMIFDLMKSIFQGKDILLKKLREDSLLLLPFSVPYLYIFELTSGWITTFIFFIITLVAGSLMKKENNTN